MADSEDVYCTLIMNDAYLPGAAVLAHSLRDSGTKKKLACLVLQDALLPSTLDELRSLYNYVIPVDRIGNPNPANLYLMNRPDLLYTFTKIQLWRQIQFRKIVYIDADVVALRAPEELFEVPESFAAAPDVGWPDAFNTGVMVLSPDMGEYYALTGLASAGDSFDGADQGLLNQYFEHRPWKRLSFTYNTTPSANYQYEPAYRYYKRDISMVHFIGSEKPWQRGRNSQGTPGAFQELLSRWWAVYDRHFKVSTTDYVYSRREPIAEYVHDQQQNGTQQTKETYSANGYPVATTGPAPPPSKLSHFEVSQHADRDQTHHQGHFHGTSAPLMTEHGERVENMNQGRIIIPSTAEQRKFSAPHMEWDATRGAPPVESKPEAANFPTQIYEFNTDPQPFRPPPAYPEPPKDMWYSVPEKPKPAEKPKPIFPWEEREEAKPTRRFIEDDPSPPPPLEPEPYADELEVSSDGKIEPVTPTIHVTDESPWAAFNTSRNAWDDVSGIENYIRALTSFQKNRGKVQVVQENVPSTSQVHPGDQENVLSPLTEPEPVDLIEGARNRRESLKLTDFPTAVERPSLPVTPAPRRRPTFWGEERDEVTGELPGAEGVPDQQDWDPNAQLEELRRNSLLGPSDLKLSEKKLPKRDMVVTAVPVPEEALTQPHVPIADRDGGSENALQSVELKERANFPGPDASTSDSTSSQTRQEASDEPKIATASSSSHMPADAPTLTDPGFAKPSVLSSADVFSEREVSSANAASEEAFSPGSEETRSVRDPGGLSFQDDLHQKQHSTEDSYESREETSFALTAEQSSSSDQRAYTSQGAEYSSGESTETETAVNTAINSSSSIITPADKSTYRESGFDNPPTIPAAEVAADEVVMQQQQDSRSSFLTRAESEQTIYTGSGPRNLGSSTLERIEDFRQDTSSNNTSEISTSSLRTSGFTYSEDTDDDETLTNSNFATFEEFQRRANAGEMIDSDSHLGSASLRFEDFQRSADLSAVARGFIGSANSDGSEGALHTRSESTQTAFHSSTFSSSFNRELSSDNTAFRESRLIRPEMSADEFDVQGESVYDTADDGFETAEETLSTFSSSEQEERDF